MRLNTIVYLGRQTHQGQTFLEKIARKVGRHECQVNITPRFRGATGLGSVQVGGLNTRLLLRCLLEALYAFHHAT
jgi:hypothetical protein